MLRLLDVRAVHEAIDRAPGRRGTPGLVALLSAPTAGPTRSELEAAFLAWCRQRLDTAPLLNARLHGHEVDALFPRQRVIVELDGAASHHTRRAFDRDRRRDSHLAAHGYVTVRLTWRRVVDEPNATARELREILEQR